MTFSDVAIVCIFVSLLWFAATKLQILFHIAAFFHYLLYIIRRNGRFLSLWLLALRWCLGEQARSPPLPRLAGMLKSSQSCPASRLRFFVLDVLFPDQFYQVEVHQAAVERSLWLDASELALLFFTTEKEVEAIPLVEREVLRLVVRIDQQEAATCLVERVNKPRLDETEHIAAEALALEITTDALGLYKFAFDRMARASPISLLKSTEPRRSSLAFINRSKRSLASPVKLCSILDAAILKDNEAGIKESLKKYIPILVSDNLDMRKKIQDTLDLMYSVRSGYIHHGKECKVEFQEIMDLNIIVMSTIMRFLQLRSTYDSPKMIIEAIDKLQLSVHL